MRAHARWTALAMASALVGCNAVLGYDTATLEATEPDPSVSVEPSSDPSSTASADASVDAARSSPGATAPAREEPTVELARGLDRPTQLAVVAASAYWLQPDGIYALDLSKTTNKPRRVVTVTGVLAFAVSVDRVYYTLSGKDGLFTAREGETPTVLIAEPHDARAVAVTGPRIFVSQSELTHGKVFWRDGSQLQNVGVPNGAEPWAMAANEMGEVFFTTRQDACAGGRVFRFASPPVEISATETCPSAIAASGGDVFVTNAIAGGSVRKLRAGAAPVDVALQQGEPIAIAASQRDVVWANHASGDIMRAPRGGGPNERLVPGLSAPSGVALDGTGATLYYVVQGVGASAGRLYRMVLP